LLYQQEAVDATTGVANLLYAGMEVSAGQLAGSALARNHLFIADVRRQGERLRGQP
jgi:hypothetical protein